MRVIETSYSGYKFRSRTEARYAVFFDALGEKWEYEKEGFDLDDRDFYLPDFWLPRLETFVEIKGQKPTEDEIRKCRKLQFFTGNQVAIFSGLPMEKDGMLFTFTNLNGGELIESYCQWTINDGFVELSEYPEPSEMLDIAARRASEARFEHGAYPNSRPLPRIVDYENLPF